MRKSNDNTHIWVTGDIHGNDFRFDEDVFYEQKEMKSSEDNYIIVCGDVAFQWDFRGKDRIEEAKLDLLEKKPFTILFVDGNHENFKRLYENPIIRWKGGKVHQIRKNILHLMRGEVYTIGGKKIFAFGGAKSHDIKDGILNPIKDIKKIKQWDADGDKWFRIDGVNWWKEEMPNEDEMKNGIINLEKANHKVDYIITHSPSTDVLPLLNPQFQKDNLMDYLQKIKNMTEYQYWFCGHMHLNKKLNSRDICLYEQIVKIF